MQFRSGFISLLLISTLGLSFTDTLWSQVESAYNLQPSEIAPAWIIAMYAPDPDPGEVMRLYTAYYRDHPFVKNQHTQYYKRWISGLGKTFLDDPTTNVPYLEAHNKAKQNRAAASWTTVGPIDWDHTAAARSYAPGSAHVYTIEQSLSHPDILYAGTANAGVWRSHDRGISWIPRTHDILTGSVTALEIHPANPDVVYAELMSNIHKSTNGGVTWQPTGNSSFQSMSFATRDIRCKPNQAQTVFAATSNGLYRSLDGGNGWTHVLSGDMLEIEFHPTRPDTVYVVRLSGDKTEFFRSLNAGNTFTQMTSGWPVPGAGDHQRRTEIAVTPDAPDKVYALATGSANGGSGLYGVYISADAGSTWTFECCGPQPAGPPSLSNPNLMGWSDQGTDDGGQYYYDLAFDVSPYNKDSIWVCGVNLWVSGNEGSSFVCPSAWSHSYKPNYVHADIHDLKYSAHTGEIWIACDGGIFYSHDSGAQFERRNVGIAGSDFWGFGMGHWYGNVMIGGAYHNGTLMKEEDTYINGWICTDGGDGVGGYVNPGLDRQAYSNYNIKWLQGDRTVAPLTRDFQYQPNSTYITGASSKLLFHPHYYGTWYTGSGTRLYLTRDNGFTFDEIHNFGVDLASMDISLSDPRVIYVCTFPDWWGTKRIYRTLDAGSTWTEVTPPASILNNADLWIPYDIAVDAHDPMRVWIVRTSMYNGYPNIQGHIVYRSDNGGTTWTNITGTGLNGQYPTSIMHQRGTNGGIYIGTRLGVYYRNATMPDWLLYNTGLPARTHSVKMLPWYRHGLIRNATDRSVWESPFYEPSAPISIPSVHRPYLFCERDTAHFVDLSVVNETGVSWTWHFPGGTPATSSLRNPKVVYSKPGVYDVSLIVSDVYGSDTSTVSGMIVADNRCTVDTTPGGAMVINAHPGHMRIDDFGVTTQTLTITAWIQPNGIQPEYSAIWMNDGTAAGFNFRENNNTLGYHWPGGAWWWDSNLTVPSGQWSHVAMVVKPGSVTLYVNGVAAVHNTSVQSVELNTVRIGSYQGWSGRTYKGKIDEVCIWNRALSEDEIRLSRHLIKVPATDPDLIGYYQFDDIETGAVVDKAQGVDGTLSGPAVIERSDAPVGSGTSQMLLIQNNGHHAFTDGGDLALAFGPSHPNGKVVVSHLRVRPDTLPETGITQGAYWIVNNYGTNQIITLLDSIRFYETGSLSHTMASGLGFRCYARQANAHGLPWRQLSFDAFTPAAGLGATIKGVKPNGTNYLGQYLIMRDSVPDGVADIVFAKAADPVPVVPAGESISLLIYSDQQGIRLPVVTAGELEALGAPVAGQITFLSDSLALVYFDGTTWKKIAHQPALHHPHPDPPAAPGQLSMSDDPGHTSALYQMGIGTVMLPGFDLSDLQDVAWLAQGMMLYETQGQRIRFYDGNAWRPLSAIPTVIPVSGDPPQTVAGIAINQSAKFPSAALEIHASGGKALQLPLVLPEEIHAPVQGLLMYHPVRQALMLYDGLRWNVVQ